MVWEEIVCMSLIHIQVIRIHVCPWDLAATFPPITWWERPKMGIVKEQSYMCAGRCMGWDTSIPVLTDPL
jgi:hypothetical protein